MTHERVCYHRRSAALAREASFVTREAQDRMSVSDPRMREARCASRGTRVRASLRRPIIDQ